MRKYPTTSTSVTSMAAAVHSSASDSTESVPAVQVYCTPNFGCHIRVSLATGAPEYGAYMKSASG